MKLWRDENRQVKKIDTGNDKIIRHNSFYLPEFGRSVDGYLYTPENRQLQLAHFKEKIKNNKITNDSIAQ